MATQKGRRHSGYVTPKTIISKKELIKNDLFINSFYDEWNNYRDGFRDWFRDFKKIKNICRKYVHCSPESYNKRIRMNLKQKKLLKRRKIRKSKYSV